MSNTIQTAYGNGRCINSEPGTFNHECGKPAGWVGGKSNGFYACYCEDCAKHGFEARQCTKWHKID